MLPARLGQHFFAISIIIAALAAGCSPREDGEANTYIGRENIRGQIIGLGLIEGATVCHDQNANGRCDANETQVFSDVSGSYQINIPKNSDSVLIAEIFAGQAKDSASVGAKVDISYKMATPSSRYSSNITPFSTMVYLANETDLPLAEDEVRNTLGLPSKFDIRLSSPAVEGSLAQAVAKAVIDSLKSVGLGIDFAAASAGEKVTAAFPPALTELPQLRINTERAAPIVSKDIYINAAFSLTNPLGSSDPAFLSGKIKGRGNTTWGQPKNPYKIQFTNDSNYSKLADFLGMKKNTNWVLLADYFDRSLIRNKLALSLGSSSVFLDGLKWNPSGQHIEVYLNDQYVGVYLLTEDIRIDPTRLAIRKMSSSTSTNDIDGGYIVEVDFRLDCFFNESIDLRHYTPRLVPFCIKKPDEDSITRNQIIYIHSLLDNIENEIYIKGNTSRLNLISFADWYIIQELFRNIDANFNSSDYMWIDTGTSAILVDRLLNMGPLWDFDRSAGNVNNLDGWLPQGCWVNNEKIQPNWMSPLMNIPEFRELVFSRWKAKRPALEKFINTSIDTYSRRLNLPQQRNFVAWPIFGVPLTNYYSFSNYAEEVAFLKSFLNERMRWLDMVFASTESFDALCK